MRNVSREFQTINIPELLDPILKDYFRHMHSMMTSPYKDDRNWAAEHLTKFVVRMIPDRKELGGAGGEPINIRWMDEGEKLNSTNGFNNTVQAKALPNGSTQQPIKIQGDCIPQTSGQDNNGGERTAEASVKENGHVLLHSADVSNGEANSLGHASEVHSTGTYPKD